MSRPFTNVAHSTLDRPPPRRVAPGVLLTRRAHSWATAKASDGMAPTAVANESTSRRVDSWITGAGMSPYFRRLAYVANRWARVGADMASPYRSGLEFEVWSGTPDVTSYSRLSRTPPGTIRSFSRARMTFGSVFEGRWEQVRNGYKTRSFTR